MALPNSSKRPRATSDARRTRWALASAVVLVLLSLLLISPGRTGEDRSAQDRPHLATQTQALP
jgi:hypothetical protein